MPTLIMESASPKFITCPDCGDRYDNARKRRLIDTCGHPRCYSCLFVDSPCPLCEKLPKQRTRTDSSVKTNPDDDTDTSQRTRSLKRGKDYVMSQPNLSNLKDMHKDRSSTLPRSFRQDSYFRSLYRYEPHGSTENLNSSRSTSPTQRPKSMPPSYHKSLENLHEQFWKSVELAERKWSPAKPVKKDGQDTNTEEEKGKTTSQSSATPPPEIVECPAPDVVRLPVPASSRPKSSEPYHHMSAEERRNELRQEICRMAQEQKEGGRPRSCSDILQPHALKNIRNDAIDQGTAVSTSRPQSWSPIQFPTATSMQGMYNGYRSSSSLSDRSFESRNSSCSSPPSSWSPTFHRSASPQNYLSDRSSDVSSIHLSDTCSVSSGDSDSLHSGIRSPTSYKSERGCNIPRPQSAMENYSSGSSPSQSPRRFPVNPLANVTYWVVDSEKSPLEVQQGLKEINLDEVIRTRPTNNGSTHARNWNGQTNRSPAAVVNVQTEVNTL